jgi:hypothetical protein
VPGKRCRTYLTTPTDIPGKVVDGTIGRVVKEPDGDDEE